MVKIETKAEAEQLTRELLALRLFKAFLAADAAGHPFTRGELNALRNVSAWPDARVLKAAQYYEQRLRDLK